MPALYETLTIRILKDVYEPGEDSYLLARAVEEKAFGKVLDMCTGSGIQGITAAAKGCEVTFADISEAALDCARNNAESNKVSGKFIKTDLFGGINDKYNTIIFNPPYLPSEFSGKEGDPRLLALDGGEDGRRYIDRFLESYKRFVLPKHTVLMIESSLNNYQKDIEKLGARVLSKEHYFFEDIVVLEFE